MLFQSAGFFLEAATRPFRQSLEPVGEAEAGRCGLPALPCALPQKVKEKDEIISSPTSGIPLSWILELISALLRAFPAQGPIW